MVMDKAPCQVAWLEFLLCLNDHVLPLPRVQEDNDAADGKWPRPHMDY